MTGTAIVGCWRIESIDMIEDRVVSLIGGLVGERIEFTEDGQYRSDVADRKPSASRYRIASSENFAELDIWILGMEKFVTRCIFRIVGDSLTICVAGDKGERPSKLLRDDQRLWCLITAERAELPKSRRTRAEKPLLEPGSLIPSAFLNKGEK